jgi:hypothetical protein
MARVADGAGLDKVIEVKSGWCGTLALRLRRTSPRGGYVGVDACAGTARGWIGPRLGRGPGRGATGLDRPCALGGREPVAAAFARGLAARERTYADRRPAPVRARARRAYAAGAAAWVYGMPTVLLRATVARYPINRLVGVARLAEPSTRVVVAPNHDTTYAIAHVDLGQGPVVVDAPDTRGRYSVLQLMDTFTNAFAYVGAGRERDRATSAALVAPHWQGALPPGLRVIRSPSNVVWVLGRTLVDSDADLPAARAVMAAYALTPLAAWQAGQRDREIVLDTFPARTVGGPVTLPVGRAFLGALPAALAANPPPARDACALRSLAAQGIVPGRRPGTPGDSVRRDALGAGARAAPGLLVRARRQAARHKTRTTGGWEALPARTVGRYGTRYALRAAVATIGLGANRADQAVYEAAERDAAGRPLNGRHRYVVRFAAGTRPRYARSGRSRSTTAGCCYGPTRSGATCSATAARACRGAGP